jgi:hypothetical protein
MSFQRHKNHLKHSSYAKVMAGQSFGQHGKKLKVKVTRVTTRRVKHVTTIHVVR